MTLVTNAPIDPNHHKGLIIVDELTGDPIAVQGVAVDGSVNVNITGGAFGGDVNLVEVGGAAIALGQTTMTASLPVTFASDQSTLTIDGTVGIDGDVTVVGKAADGAAVSGNPVLIAGEDPSGNVAQLQTATDGDLIVHAHSALTALADNVSNTMQIPVNQTDLGFLATPIVSYYYDGSTWDRVRGDSTNGMLVNLGSNNDVTVTGTVQNTPTRPATATLANVTMTGSSVTLQASNANRQALTIFNDSGVVVYIKFGSSASATSFTVKMVDQAYYEVPSPVYSGIVTAFGASGSVRVSEVTA